MSNGNHRDSLIAPYAGREIPDDNSVTSPLAYDGDGSDLPTASADEWIAIGQAWQAAYRAWRKADPATRGPEPQLEDFHNHG